MCGAAFSKATFTWRRADQQRPENPKDHAQTEQRRQAAKLRKVEGWLLGKLRRFFRVS